MSNTRVDIETYRNRIIHGDAVAVMRKIENSSIDLILTSPPYNLRNSTGRGLQSPSSGGKWRNAALVEGYDGYDDKMPHAEYVAWQRECLTEMMRIIKPTGAIFYNHKWRVQNGKLQTRDDILDGFPVRQIIIWKRSGGMNFNKGYFVPTYEVLYMICGKDFKLTKGANSHGDVWQIPQDRNNPHPAPFPVGLAARVISSVHGNLVLDPFIGSGTTAVAAKELGWDFIGIDCSEEYVHMAYNRLGS